jgi:hypothetical protein
MQPLLQVPTKEDTVLISMDELHATTPIWPSSNYEASGLHLWIGIDAVYSERKNYGLSSPKITSLNCKVNPF